MSDADSITREEAIAEVARLRAEISRMREWDPVINAVQAERDRFLSALRHIAKQTEGYDPLSKIGLIHSRARAALTAGAQHRD